MKIVKIDEPQTSKRNFPFIATTPQTGPTLYLITRDGAIFLEMGSTGNVVPWHQLCFKLENCLPVMGAVTLLNE